MSTIKSSDEHLTLNADGSGKDIKFQANGVEKASISSAGAFTSTTIDATKLTGDLPAISGANLTGVGVSGITSSADATAMTITSAERIGINHTTPEARLEIDGGSETGLFVRSTVAGEYPAIFQSASTGTVPITDFRNNGGTSQLKVLSNGRVISQSNIGFWVRFETSGTPSIQDSYNVTSIGDWGTGDYGIYITSGFSNTNYCVHGTTHDSRRVSVNTDNTAPQGGRVDIEIRNNSNALEDMDIVYVSAIGDM